MNSARIVVLAVASAPAALLPILQADRIASPSPGRAGRAAADRRRLVAKADIGLGQTVTPNDMQWQSWPAATASNAFIRRNERPDATNQIAGSMVRSPFIAGEPIREAKLVKANGSGFMAAILPPGMRAVSTEISPETGAGGFILPNDRVDVILSKREKDTDRTQPLPTSSVSQIILSNIRVLAIDQAPKEKDGQNAVVGKTVTLELRPEQAETLARRAPDRHAVAGAAQHRRHQNGRGQARRPGSEASAKRSA